MGKETGLQRSSSRLGRRSSCQNERPNALCGERESSSLPETSEPGGDVRLLTRRADALFNCAPGSTPASSLLPISTQRKPKASLPHAAPPPTRPGGDPGRSPQRPATVPRPGLRSPAASAPCLPGLGPRRRRRGVRPGTHPPRRLLIHPRRATARRAIPIPAAAAGRDVSAPRGEAPSRRLEFLRFRWLLGRRCVPRFAPRSPSKP